jgi:hypothetical protein
MAYLNDGLGVLAGYLPEPHAAVRIEVGPVGIDRLYVRYEGTRAALLAAGAIDAQMAHDTQHEERGRDRLARPYRCETAADGRLTVSREFSSIKKAYDLPGIGGERPLEVSPLTPRQPQLRLIVNDPQGSTER